MQNYPRQSHDHPMDESVFDDDLADLNDSTTDLKFRHNNNSHQVVHRALSTVSANQTLVNNQRNALAKNFRRISINDEIVTIDHTDADSSFLLPNLYELPDAIRTRVTNSLVDTTTMATLEETKRLNWWINNKLPCPKLYPLLTSGDGNCLLHATSLAMWGFHDHSLSMRKALNETLITSKPNSSLYRRWRWAQSVQNKKYGLVFSEQEWDEEWKSLLRLSSVEPRISQTNSMASSDSQQRNQEINTGKSSQINGSISTGGSTANSNQSTRQYYESLEEFHVYVLANNIRRPIIVYSDTILRTNDGEAISPIEFGGIYLPLEIPPEKCHKQPVFLAFDAAHFSALVPMEQNTKVASKALYRIPLIDIATNDLLPIHFLIDPGPKFSWPIDEELPDEKIHLYTHFGYSRMEVLESYLYLSKETCVLDHLHSPGKNFPELDSTPNTENPRSIQISVDSSASINDNISLTTPITQKKLTRPSLNSFSKMIRRTFIEPFSLGKRASIKQRHQNTSEGSDGSIINENEPRRRLSSPLLNSCTKVLTIILTNFQPKRPKTCDNMIKNYIDACLNEYRKEKNKQRIIENSTDENEYVTTNTGKTHVSDANYRSPPTTHYRSYASTPNNRNNQEPNLATIIKRNSQEQKKNQLSNYSNNSKNLSSRQSSQNYDIDDTDDSLMLENGQISSNINYVQIKSKTYTQPDNFEYHQTRSRHVESQQNRVSSHRTRIQQVIQSPSSRSIARPLPSTFQPVSLKRQLSLGYDRNNDLPKIPDPSTNTNRGSIKASMNTAQLHRSSHDQYSRTVHHELGRRP